MHLALNILAIIGAASVAASVALPIILHLQTRAPRNAESDIGRNFGFNVTPFRRR